MQASSAAMTRAPHSRLATTASLHCAVEID
jgi:hypothetical protein